MSDTKEKRATFTPGPWVVKHDKQGLPFVGAMDWSTCDPWTYHETVATVDTGAGDARLIAAAPELYEQCKLFEKCLTYLINSGDSGADLERDNLRAILDKVDGGEGWAVNLLKKIFMTRLQTFKLRCADPMTRSIKFTLIALMTVKAEI
jgi:hypothetical protein